MILFNHINVYAANPIIKIYINNQQEIPLTFNSQNRFGNSCVSQSPTKVVCTITNTNPPIPFLLSLQWNNTKNSADCGVDVNLFGSGNSFYFSYDGTYNGSFTTQTWDGKSNVSGCKFILIKLIDRW